MRDWTSGHPDGEAVGEKPKQYGEGNGKMKQQEIWQERRRHGGSLAVDAANEIETIAAGED